MSDFKLYPIDYNFSRDLIQGYEFFLAPLYLLVFYFITRLIIWKYFNDAPYKKFIIPAAGAKIIGGLIICFVYNYYYVGGDPMAYFNDGNNLARLFIYNPIDYFRIIFSDSSHFPREYISMLSNFRYANYADTFLVVRITSFIELFSFNSFLITSMMFGYLSFWALLQLYILCVKFYPSLYKEFVYAFFFIPSLVVWGSSILKDTITLSALALFIVFSYRFFIEKKYQLKLIAGILICSYLLIVIKIYILLSILAPLLLWFFSFQKEKIKHPVIRSLITPFIIVFALLISFAAINYIGNLSYKEIYSFDKIMDQSKVQREYLYYVSKNQGAAYTLGEFDEGFLGILSIIPSAINATFFRPYLWESNNFIMVFSALESFFFLVFTLFAFFKGGMLRSFKVIYDDPFVTFCLLYSLTFGFFVGLSSYNFGSLVRYKIPCLAFYMVAMVVIYKKKSTSSKP